MNFNPFATKTVDAVLSVFNKTISDLKEIEKQNYNEFGKLSDEISQLYQRQTAHRVEAMRAEEVREKLERLIGVQDAEVGFANDNSPQYDPQSAAFDVVG